MTNKQKAEEICKRHIFDSNHFDCCMEMAEWKDEQFSIERKQLIEKANQAVTQSFENGAIFKKQEMIDKACEWLIKGGYFVNNTETIEDFKNYMKGE